MGGDAKLVALHTCKACGVRMFEHDREGHLARHAFPPPLRDISSYFTRGKKDTFDKPCGNHQPLYRKTKKRK